MKKKNVIDLFDNNKIVQNKGVKYSELLEAFMTPFASAFDDFEYYEDFIDIAVLAWNIGNISKSIGIKEIKKVLSKESISGKNKNLIQKMIQHKVENFSNHTNFIVDYEIKGIDTDPILSVITQTFEDHQNSSLNNQLDEIDLYEEYLDKDYLNNEFTEDDYAPGFINRHAFIFKRKAPYKEWVQKIAPDFNIETFNEHHISLINDNEFDSEEWIKKNWRTIFINDLDFWEENKKKWPKKRTYQMFTEWFSFSFSTMIYDLEDSPVYKN